MAQPIAPTSILPPLLRISAIPVNQVFQALHDIRTLYWPPTPLPNFPVRPPLSRRSIHALHDDSVPDSGYASAEEDEDDVDPCDSADIESEYDFDALRSDSFERDFTIRWLTGFIARCSDSDTHAEIIDEASELLRLFTGDDNTDSSSAPSLTRRFSFARSVTAELNDAPLSKDDHTCVGLQSWASSIIFAEKLCASPDEFGLVGEKLRVLELGAGTGLLSIVAAKLLQGSTVVATDYHPDVLANLVANVRANFPFPRSPVAVDVQTLDWEQPVFEAPLDKPFDVILAADVIYHPKHAHWIKTCVEKLLIRPSEDNGGVGGVFWMVIPLRSTGRHEGMTDTVDQIFPDGTDNNDGGFQKLAIVKREEAERVEGVGRADEGGYKLFKIGWVG